MNHWRKHHHAALSLIGLLALFVPALARADFGSALNFNGTSSFVSIPVISASNINAFSLEAWIKPANITDTQYSDILCQQGFFASPDWLLGFQSHGKILSFGLRTGGVNGYGELQVPINPAYFTDGNWHHIAATYDGTNKILYVDGLWVGSMGQTGNLTFIGTADYIGAQESETGTGEFFNGQIDEVRIWSVARSTTDILNNLDVTLTGTESGLLAYYQFDEGTGSSTADASNHGLTGTLVNNPTWAPSTVPKTVFPFPVTGFASSVKANSATLNGTVVETGTATTFYFDYGTTTNYGIQTPLQDLAITTAEISVSAPISGLSQASIYHYRLVAIGGGVTNRGSDQAISTPAPVFGNALSLNGTSSYVRSPVIYPGAINTFSLEAWIKPANLTATTYSDILRQQGFSTQVPDFLLAFQGNGTLLTFGLDTSVGGYQELHVPINAADYTDGNWHHLAATYDGTTKRIYVDGILIGSVAQTGSTAFAGSESEIGAGAGFTQFSIQEFFNGQIDEVRIWSVARSAANINSNLFTTLSGNEPGLLAYYRFDEGSGTSTTDSSPNGHSGTLVNNPVWIPSTVPTMLPPLPITSAASNVAANSATLNGTVYAWGTATAVYFDYGTTTNYGSQTPLQNLGIMSGATSISAPISGLSILNTYHYRLVAIGAGATNRGIDQVISTPAPVFGNALSLNGTSSFVSIPVISTSNINAFSLEAWIKPANLTATTYSDILRQQVYSSGVPCWMLAFQGKGTLLTFGLATSGPGYQELHVPINPADYTDGNWHHLAATYDGTTKRIYVDGILIGSVAQTGPVAYSGSDNGIGAWPSAAGSEFFNGQIDEVRIWSVARSAIDINNNLVTTLSGNEPGLLAYYRFDEGSGNSTVDSSPNGLTGTLINNPVWIPSTVPTALPPLPLAAIASNVGANSATLNGTVIARGVSGSAYFDYGMTTNYGFQTPLQSLGGTPGTSPVSALISGLSVANVYHFRLVATGGGATNRGVDQSFATPAPVFGNALSFNGTSSFVGIPVINPGVISTLSLEAWIRPANLTATTYSDILRQQGAASLPDWLLSFDNNGSLLTFGLKTDNGGYQGMHVAINPADYTDGNWHNIAATYDGTTKSIYVDGVLIGTAAQTGNLSISASNSGIGAGYTPNGIQEYFNGQIDEVRFWAVARSATDIFNNLYTTLSGSEPGLLAYYRFDEGAGTSTADSGPNGHTGTLINNPVWVPSTVPTVLPPLPFTGAASSVSANSATLNGTVFVRGITGLVHFDYGTTTNYGSQTPLQSLGITSGIASISVPTSGLSVGVTYHYRLVATEGSTTKFGADQLFRTITPIGGTALKFNGSNSFVSIPVINPGPANTLSLEAWIKPVNIVATTYSDILRQQNFTSAPDWLLGFQNNGTILTFGLTVKVQNTVAYNELHLPINPSNYTDGNWHHIAATYDGTTKRIYVDGLLAGFAPQMGSLAFSGSLSGIGASPISGGSEFFNGQIDEVRIWSVARSATDILSNLVTTLSGEEPGLLAYYRFDEGSGTSLADSSPYARAGTLVGGATWLASTVPAMLPSAAFTGLPSNISNTSATFNGTAYVRGGTTTVYFDYGASTNYGAQTSPQILGVTSGLAAVAVPLSGLSIASPYHYRLVAIGGGGTNFGVDQAFNTIGPIGGTALYFNGTNSYVSSSAINPGVTNAFSLETWIKPLNITATMESDILREEGAGPQTDWLLAFENSGNLLSFGLRTTTGYHEFHVSINPSDFTDGNWHHLAATYDGTNKSVYADGVLLSSTGESGNVAFVGTTIRIGAEAFLNGGTDFFNGLVDEVRIWNVARSAADINNNIFTILNTTEPGLMLYYRFDEGAGSTATDSSPNRFSPGTLMNNPLWVPSTVPSAPFVEAFTGFASNIATNSATLNGLAGTRGIPTLVYFDYGATTNYGTQTPIQNIGSGQGGQPVAAPLSGLAAGSAYHFRLVAVGGGVTNAGADHLFYTIGPVGGAALSFDGSSSVVSIPGFIPLNNTLSLEAWIKPLDLTSNFVSAIIYQESGPSSPECMLAFENNGTVLAFGSKTVQNGYYPEFQVSINPADFTDGNWHHIAATYDGAFKRLYVDGILIGSTAQTGNLNFSPTDSLIGGQRSFNVFNGQIDEVRIWGSARSATDINNNRFSTLAGTESGLLAYYRFDEGAGNLAFDSTTNVLTGTLNNNPVWVPSTVPVNLGPVVITSSPSNIASNSATANGLVYPRGIDTRVYFDFGATTNYGNQTPLQSAGNVTNEVVVSTLLSNLSAGGTYHYRLAAVGNGVTNLGKDQFLSTPAAIGGSALSLNGVSGYVLIPAVNPGAINAFSLEAWIKPASLTNTPTSMIFHQETIAAANDFALGFQNNGTLLVFGLRTSNGYSELQVTINPSSFTDGYWHHIAAVYDGSTKRVYIDGLLVGIATQTGSLAFAGTASAIGASPLSGGSRFFNGQIDEARIWSVARSATDVRNGLFTTIGTPHPGLIAYYQFDDGAGSFATDSSGGGHTANLVNSAGWTTSTVPGFLPLIATTGATTNQALNSATLLGTVFQRGSSATAYFDFGPNTNYGFQTIPQNFAAGLSTVSVTGVASNLAPAQSYHYRLVATYPGGTVFGQDNLLLPRGNGGGGYALSFNGTNSYVTANAVNLNGGTNLTLEAWTKPADITSTTYSDVLRQETFGGTPDWTMQFQAHGTVLSFGLKTGNNNYVELHVSITASNYTDGNWHHLAATYDGSTKRLYLDGALIGSAPQSGSVNFTGRFNGIGAAPISGGGSEFFNGVIDEVRVWNVTKSVTQINQFMNRQLTGAEAGLMAYYPFSEGLGTTTADLTGKGHTGTLINSPLWVRLTAPLLPYPCAITGFSPPFGRQGTSVTLTGTNFLSVSSVSFNGVSASFLATSDTALTAIVPAGATTGPLSIVNATTNFVTSSNFIVDVTAPTIAISAPTNATIVTGLANIGAVATDNAGGSGVNTVTFSLQRQSDLGFWNGSAWGVSNALPAVLNGGQWSPGVALPSGTNLNNGAYTIYATATDFVGNSASTNIWVTVNTAGSGKPIGVLPDGNIQIRFAGVPGKTYRVQTSTDLFVWVDVGTVTVDSSGVLLFEDTDSANHSTRFYRTVTP
ncbi:MAG: hypothetical protein JWR26_1915 [Pedosphaera sp.]|nr:hypothetical protein [Pedosphaera sp.]